MSGSLVVHDCHAAVNRAKKSYEEENPKLKKRGPPPPKKGLPSNKKFRR